MKCTTSKLLTCRVTNSADQYGPLFMLFRSQKIKQHKSVQKLANFIDRLMPALRCVGWKPRFTRSSTGPCGTVDAGGDGWGDGCHVPANAVGRLRTELRATKNIRTTAALQKPRRGI